MINSIISLISVLIISALGFLGITAEPINAKAGTQAVFEFISDTHIDCDEYILQTFLKSGFYDMRNAECEINGVLIAGDITNYGDPESLDTFYDILNEKAPTDDIVIASGNHDIGHAEDRGLTNDEARENFISRYNEYSGENTEKIYYSTEVDGYTFIILSDESEDNWDALEMSEEQLSFLDEELKKNSNSEKPVFVVCHWPVYGTNGLVKVYEDGLMEIPDSEKVHNIMKQYKNVFYVSGHAHAGFNGLLVNNAFGVNYVEIIDGVTYVNLPSFGLPNRYGIPWPCTGLHVEIYNDKVVFRPRNYLRGSWYERRNVTVSLIAE